MGRPVNLGCTLEERENEVSNSKPSPQSSRQSLLSPCLCTVGFPSPGDFASWETQASVSISSKEIREMIQGHRLGAEPVENSVGLLKTCVSFVLKIEGENPHARVQQSCF